MCIVLLIMASLDVFDVSTQCRCNQGIHLGDCTEWRCVCLVCDARSCISCMYARRRVCIVVMFARMIDVCSDLCVEGIA